MPAVAIHRAPLKPLRLAVILIAAGAAAVGAALGAERLSSMPVGLAPYAAGLVYLAALAWSEMLRPTSGRALPAWLSPPALIASWMLVWIYGPATLAFFDDALLDEFANAHGGPELLNSGLLLACAGLTALWCSFRATGRLLGRRGDGDAHDTTVALNRVVALYLASVTARLVRTAVVGVAFGADTSLWGALAPADQWLGYAEDLRYLGLSLLVAHVVTRRTESGRLWLWAALVTEVLFAATSGFIKPFVWPVVVGIVTAAVFDRVRVRYLLLTCAAMVAISTFWPVVASIREHRASAIEASNRSDISTALTSVTQQWLNGLSGLDSAYEKFFGRQTEVAASTGLVVALVPAVIPYEGLGQLALVPAKLVPRVVWQDKPVVSRGVWFSITFRGFVEDTSSSSAMTIFGEGFLFDGWTGLVLTMLLTGVLLAVLHHKLNTPRLAAVYLALLPTILEIEPELSSYLTSLVQRSIVFVIVFLLLTHRSAGRGAVAGAA